MGATVQDCTAVRAHEMRVARSLAARLFAQAAVDRRPDAALAARLVHDPRREAERRFVPHVPLVAAGELRDPVAAVVLVEADDLALHTDSVRPHR